jgi:hypothetical protein
VTDIAAHGTWMNLKRFRLLIKYERVNSILMLRRAPTWSLDQTRLRDTEPSLFASFWQHVMPWSRTPRGCAGYSIGQDSPLSARTILFWKRLHC